MGLDVGGATVADGPDVPELARKGHARSAPPGGYPAEDQYPVVTDLLDLIGVVVELREVLLDRLDEHLQPPNAGEDALAELGRELRVEVAGHQGAQFLEALAAAANGRPVEAVDAPDQVGTLSHS